MQQAQPYERTRLLLALDLVERAIVAAFFGAMAWSFLRSWQETGNVVSLIMILSEGSVVAFVLMRRFAHDISVRPADWLIALLGTLAPLLARPTADGSLAPALVCVPLLLTGFAVQIAAKLTLCRSFGVVAANRGVQVKGPYRLARHPMYAGYIMMQIAFLLTNPSVWNGLVYLISFAAQLSRILAEERVLGRDPSYQDFAAAVRYRLAPGLF